MIWFDRNAARGLTVTLALHIRVARRRKPLSFALRIEDGHLRVRRGAPAAAAATITMRLRDLLALAVGSTGWPQLLAAGRLELTGDPFLALRFPGLFKLPASAAGK